MSSPFDKYHWQMTVPTGGWTFDTSLGSTTIAADTYWPLELLEALEDGLNADVATRTWVVAVTEYGIVSVTADDVWLADWAGTSNDLEAALGYDGTEAVASLALTANDQHDYGYYPGCISYGYSVGGGAGRSGDTRWLPDWRVNHVIAGSGASRMIAPSSPIEKRTITYGMIKFSEVEDDSVGTIGWWNSCAAAVCRWYIDRSYVTIGDSETEGTDYYDVAINGNIRINQGGHPDWCSATVTLAKQP